MKTIALVAGGTLSKTLLEDIKSHDVIIGIDRGAWWLIAQTIIPDYAIGDFDSVTKEELQIIQETSPNVVQYRVEKNETDLELGIELAVKLDPKSIKIFGSIGTRIDHTLAGIFLLSNYETDVTVVDENNQLSVIQREKTIKNNEKFPYCSFISLTETAEITLTGFKYPLDHGILHQNKTLGISNELVKSSGNIIVHKGKVLCIQSRG